MTVQSNHASNAATETPNSDKELEEPPEVTHNNSLSDNETTEVEEIVNYVTSDTSEEMRKLREEADSDGDYFEEGPHEEAPREVVEDLEEQKEEDIEEMCVFLKELC